MRKRDAAGLSLAPLVLRLMLAVMFLWAGAGKLASTFDVDGERAAILANYGVIDNPNARTQTPAPTENEVPSETPADQAYRSADSVSLVAMQNEGEPNQTEQSQNDGTEPSTDASGAEDQARDLEPAPTRALATAADFEDPVEARGWMGILLALHGAMSPSPDPEDGSERMALWPDLDPDLDYDPWPVRAALAVAFTELIGGVLLLVGLLTRIGALGITGVMLGAVWLTTIGPAIQSGDTHLGFLPAHDPWDIDAWTKPLWQLSLVASSFALALLGPGTLSLDRLLLGGPGTHKKPDAKPAPKK